MERRSSNIFYSELNLLSADNRSGSKELLSKINNLIIRDLDYIDLNKTFFQNLSESFQSFEVIQKYLNDLQKFAVNKSTSEIRNFLQNFEINSKSIYDKIYYNLLKELNNPVSVITISNSETVYEVVKRLSEENLLKKVVICESRPQYEGRDLALKLSSIGAKVEIILDAKIPDYIKEIDIALIGTDVILTNGNAVNKIGSKALAICCKYFSKPLYVIGDSLKFSQSDEFSQLKRSTHEIWENHPENITIKNFYFEEIEGSLISKIISESDRTTS